MFAGLVADIIIKLAAAAAAAVNMLKTMHALWQSMTGWLAYTHVHDAFDCNVTAQTVTAATAAAVAATAGQLLLPVFPHKTRLSYVLGFPLAVVAAAVSS